MKKLVFLVIAVAGFGISSFAQQTDVGHATATVIKALSVEEIGAGLNFGTFGSTSAVTTVTIAPTAGGARTGDADMVLTAAGNSGDFKVVGEEDGVYSFVITELAAGIDLVGTVPADIMHMTFSQSVTNNGLLTAGEQHVYVGGTLTVPVNANAGTYTGTYNVSVAYN